MHFYRKTGILTLVLSLLIVSCSPTTPPVTATMTPSPPLPDTTTPTPTELPRKTYLFTELEGDVQNPERGFVTDADYGELDFSEYYEDGYSLVYADIRLDEYREMDLSEAFLENMDNWLSALPSGGVKAIVRFSYNDGPYPDPEPDASLEQILKHIEQVKPVLQKNSDVIAWVEAGFIGAWGEWHSSTHGLDSNIDAKQSVVFALLDALPSNRMVLLRYPVDIMTIFPERLSEEEAFSGSNQSRVGFHNDCFLSSVDDEHTYGRHGVISVSSELEYLYDLTRFVPVGGESCAYNPPRTDCPSALQEVEALHFSELNDGWYPDVLDEWEEQGCYDDIQSRLGYRYSLRSATLNEIVKPGSSLSLDVELENTGYAAMINPRPIHVVVDGPEHYDMVLPIDPRRWAPGEVSTFQATFNIPENALVGEYIVGLWLPDASVNLQNDLRYTVRFANEEVWDAKTGYNILAKISVTSNQTP